MRTPITNLVTQTEIALSQDRTQGNLRMSSIPVLKSITG
ncbi:hypothetical protein [Klebsiella pneumoniae]